MGAAQHTGFLALLGHTGPYWVIMGHTGMGAVPRMGPFCSDWVILGWELCNPQVPLGQTGMGEMQPTSPPALTGPYWDGAVPRMGPLCSNWAILGWEWCNPQVPLLQPAHTGMGAVPRTGPFCSNWAILGWGSVTHGCPLP